MSIKPKKTKTKVKVEEQAKDLSKYLVIVESPTKARTISSILGKDYEVTSSMGHLVDLPSNKISVDVENGFKPVYQVIPGKEKMIAQLKKKAKGK
ncbi:MAG: DNA topoisomerase I, partial [Candidatus Omnitrophica bacterium]|nr:DNA topoisomerase I [Candidatus Omnitrophota bacterium]